MLCPLLVSKVAEKVMRTIMYDRSFELLKKLGVQTHLVPNLGSNYTIQIYFHAYELHRFGSPLRFELCLHLHFFGKQDKYKKKGIGIIYI